MVAFLEVLRAQLLLLQAFVSPRLPALILQLLSRVSVHFRELLREESARSLRRACFRSLLNIVISDIAHALQFVVRSVRILMKLLVILIIAVHNGVEAIQFGQLQV